MEDLPDHRAPTIFLEGAGLSYMPDISTSRIERINLQGNSINVVHSEYIPTTCKSIDICLNKIHSDGLPDSWPNTLEAIDLGSNYIRSTEGILWPLFLKRLSLANNPLIEWPPMLPNTLEYMNVDKTDIQMIDPLPGSLQVLSAKKAQVRQLPPIFPDGLLNIFLSSNNLKMRSLPQHWGNSLKVLNLDGNFLTGFPNGLPDTLECLSLRRNRIQEIPSYLPSNLIVLNVAQNQIKTIHPTSRHKPIFQVFLNDNELTESVRDYQVKHNLRWATHIEEFNNWNQDIHHKSQRIIYRAVRAYRLRKRLRTWRKTAFLKEELQQVAMHPCRAGLFEDISQMWGC